MTHLDVDVIQRRLLAMKDLVAHLETLGRPAASDLATDLGLRLQVSMALAQLATLAAEINSHVVVAQSSTAPGDMRDSFHRMAAIGWIDTDLAGALQNSTGLRNVVIHEYVRVDLAAVAAAIPLAIDGFGRYIRQVARQLPSV